MTNSNVERILQNFHLVWLDESINSKDVGCCDCIVQLRQVINTVNIFDDIDECIDFIADQAETAWMLVSEEFTSRLIPVAETISQIKYIYVFGENISNKDWINKCSKIVGSYTNIQTICEKLQQDSNDDDHNTISISFAKSTTTVSNTVSKDNLDCSFMYTQILKEILLTIDFNDQHFNEFISYCRVELAGNAKQLRNVDKIEKEYRDHNPIWWYTYECFLYQMLNKALRLMDVDIIVKIGFFLRDLHEHITALYLEQFNGNTTSDSFTVYRAQRLSQTDFDQLKQNENGLLAFNNFLSTSKNRNIAMRFINRNSTSSDLVPVFFVMQVDPSIQATPFANVASTSTLKKEEEILFSMHSIFRIERIKQIDGSIKFWEVQLTFTSDHDPKLSELTIMMREYTRGLTGWYRLASLMANIAKYDKAEDLYKTLLINQSSESEKAFLLYRLGDNYRSQGHYTVALKYFEKFHEMLSFPQNYSSFVAVYSNMGHIYEDMADYHKALEYYKKSLEILGRFSPEDDLSFANIYNHMGLVYAHMGKYSEALGYNKKSFKIRKKFLPDTHPDLAESYQNVGSMYYQMCDYSKALGYYKKSLEIEKRSLPENHPAVAESYSNVGSVYGHMNEYSKALEYYEKSLRINQKIFHETHPKFAVLYKNMGSVYECMHNYPQALTCYEKSLEISRKSFPENHPTVAQCYYSMGSTYDHKKEYDKALVYHNKALKIRKKTLPDTHPDLAESYQNVGSIYDDTHDYFKAIECYKSLLEIRKKILPKNHPDLAQCYHNMGLIYHRMHNCSEAIKCYEKSFEILKKSPRENHFLFANIYSSMALIYFEKRDRKKTLECLQCALSIVQRSLPIDYSKIEDLQAKIKMVKQIV